MLAPAACAADRDAWFELSKPGAILLLRHANAPGAGDPPQFQLGDCSTQRNLDERGRADARRIGEQFRAHRIPVGAALSSQWCRTLETARLAFGDKVREESAFNSLRGLSPAARRTQTAVATSVLARWRGRGALVVVTHPANIEELAGVGAASAEGVVVRLRRNGSLLVLATVAP